uniref:Uncharacterized protein n=1 Tax=viral metagenome TaxID=1070528 RepID=A0A6C0BN22_9ZZZZ
MVITSSISEPVPDLRTATRCAETDNLLREYQLFCLNTKVSHFIPSNMIHSWRGIEIEDRIVQCLTFQDLQGNDITLRPEEEARYQEIVDRFPYNGFCVIFSTKAQVRDLYNRELIPEHWIRSVLPFIPLEQLTNRCMYDNELGILADLTVQGPNDSMNILTDYMMAVDSCNIRVERALRIWYSDGYIALTEGDSDFITKWKLEPVVVNQLYRATWNDNRFTNFNVSSLLIYKLISPDLPVIFYRANQPELISCSSVEEAMSIAANM